MLDGFFRPGHPARGFALVVRKVSRERSLAGDGSGGTSGGAFDHRFHFPDCLFEHDLRVFEAVDQVVQVCGDDVADSLE